MTEPHQVTLFEWLGEAAPFNPLEAVALEVEPMYRTSRRKLAAMVRNRATPKDLAFQCQMEYAPWDFAGHYGFEKPNTVHAWEMNPAGVRVKWTDERGVPLEKRFTWREFSEVIRELIQRGEYGEGDV